MAESEKQMLVSEVNLLRELKHPNIVRYYDRIIDRTNTTLYIVMEHCEGGDLSSLITRCIKERWKCENVGIPTLACVFRMFIAAIFSLSRIRLNVASYYLLWFLPRQTLFGGAVHPASHGPAHVSPEGVPQTEWRQGHRAPSRPETSQHLPRHQTER